LALGSWLLALYSLKTMKLNSLLFFTLVIIFSGLVSCKKQSPQLPSNKGMAIDSTAVSLLNINHQLAIKEDSILRKYALLNGHLKKSETGFWYKIVKNGNGGLIKDSVACSFSYKLKLLNGKTIESGQKQLIIGKKELIVGLEEGLKLMHKGDSAIFVIPWYLGYGISGRKPSVPPYSSLIYEIKSTD
jgi:FKBP-type peptidyl-prolyl cis-trans isomerase